MPIRVDTKNGLPLLHIEGEMSIYSAAVTKTELMPYLTQPQAYEIDLSNISEIDSAGLQLLMLAKREAARHGSSLLLTGHSRAVLEILELCNLVTTLGDPVLTIRDTNRQSLARTRRSQQ